MKEHPIIFSSEMVKAILDGRKTMTRRTNGLAWINQHPDDWLKSNHHVDKEFVFLMNSTGEPKWISCPYGQVGDRLWVRETWQTTERQDLVLYKADYTQADLKAEQCDFGKWRPSIFMPRWASRITLEITGVRVERVQEITEEDCIREGWNRDRELFPLINTYDKAKAWFVYLWDFLNAKRGYSWNSNPFVWVIEFGAMGVRTK